MEKNIWKNAFGRLEMPAEVKEEIWERFEKEVKGGNYNESGKRIRGCRGVPHVCRYAGRWVMAAVIISFIGILTANLQTGGRIVEALQKLWKVEQGSQEIVEHSVDYHITLDGEFAPNLIECSDKRIVFASSVGLIVYDRTLKQVVGTVDLQEIESFQFDDTFGATRFLPEGDKLTIYNRKDGTAIGKGYIVAGDCYVYDLAQCSLVERGEIKALKPVEVTPATDALQSRWREKVKNFRKKTVSEYKDRENIFTDCMHSKYSLRWEALNGKKYSSCLVIPDVKESDTQAKKYQLLVYHKDLETGEIEKEFLELLADMPESAGEEKLPEYQYTGNDLLVKALTDCAKEDWKVYCGYNYSLGTSYVPEFREEAVIIPVIHIYQVKEGGKYTKVYGLFTYLDVVRHKRMLYDSDGASSGNRLGCAYLEKTSDGYHVNKIVHPLDGHILEDMEALCNGNKKMAEKLVNRDKTKDREAEEQKLLREYVNANHLDIRYYNPSAGNPIEID